MPNWCDNRLAIAGPPAVVRLLVEELEGPEQPLDFEQLLPTPGELVDGAGNRAAGMPAELPGWYQWRLEHWGVKWNACDVARRGYGRTGRVRYRFFTPYGPPMEFLDHVARRYPEVGMDLVFAVELLGGGRASWRAGARCAYEQSPAF